MTDSNTPGPDGDDEATWTMGDDLWAGMQFDEDEEPAEGLFTVNDKKPHIDAVRQKLAFIVVIPLVALYAVVIVGSFWFPAEKATALVAALSGLSSLAAAVIGFYFGQRSSGD